MIGYLENNNWNFLIILMAYKCENHLFSDKCRKIIGYFCMKPIPNLMWSGACQYPGSKVKVLSFASKD